MAKSVDLYYSTRLTLRSFTLKRSLLKQAKRLKRLTEEFLDGKDVNEKCIGYVKGSAFGEDEHTDFLIFIHKFDLYIFGWPGYKGKAKQIYM